jgi:hypothetical protein
MQINTTTTILVLLLLAITFYLVKSKENYTTYLITPDLITETPVDIGYWRLGYGQPLPYEDISGYSPMLEQQENFVGADSERRTSTCLDDNLQPLEGYPKHGFEPVCEMTFPKEKAPKIMGLDIPMRSVAKSDNRYLIGQWVHFGKGYEYGTTGKEILDVYLFSIDPTRNLYRYAVKTKNGEFYELTFDIERYGLEDGYIFTVEQLNKEFLFRENKRTVYM